jgi:hypothetical protein
MWCRKTVTQTRKVWVGCNRVAFLSSVRMAMMNCREVRFALQEKNRGERLARRERDTQASGGVLCR